MPKFKKVKPFNDEVAIRKVAKIFFDMQQLHGELINNATRTTFTKKEKISKTQLVLAHLLNTGKDAMKKKFIQITSGNLYADDNA